MKNISEVKFLSAVFFANSFLSSFKTALFSYSLTFGQLKSNPAI
jgi:hypothetical protein